MERRNSSERRLPLWPVSGNLSYNSMFRARLLVVAGRDKDNKPTRYGLGDG
ncbi:MAG: hypothetical protein ACLR6J_20210 [Parabacteroides merdae]